ncbi:MAG TPA: tetratricopeptide repeat protein [Blastocatellia bacterium]|nr:tetratricopeptide repeat protein [Blastocatellia bacterium]
MMQPTKTETVREAQMLIDSGRVSAAISIYQKIVESDSSDLAAISVLSDLYVKAGRVADAAEHLLRIAENYVRSGSANSASHILNKVLKLDPTNARAHMNLGELRSHEGKTDQAHACFIEAGAAFWHKGNINAAIKMNKRALENKPDSRQAKTALALLQQEVEQSELPPPPPQPQPQAQIPRVKAEVITGTLEEILISIPDEPGKPFVEESFQYGKSQPVFSPPPVVETPLAMSDSVVSPAQDGLLNGLSDDAIVEQIARAELLVAYGQADEGVLLLRETLLYRPDHIEIRAKLKDIYLRCEMRERAIEECINIAGIYAARGDLSRARDHTIRARLLSDPDDQIALLAVLEQDAVDLPDEVQEARQGWNPEMRQAVAVM